MTKLVAVRRQPPSLVRRDPEDVWALFARAPVARLASTAQNGEPLLRTLHVVVVDGALYFHGGGVGEKVGCLSRAAVMACDESIATLPSYFFDPKRACPATTYYESAMAWGIVEEVASLSEKARILTALMKRYQPEGLHDAIVADDPQYSSALDKLLVAKLVPERLEGRLKVGQNKSRALMEGVLVHLWRRGHPGDLQALERIRASHPERLRPSFLHYGDVRFEVAPRDVEGALRLVKDEYWNTDVPAEIIARSHAESDCWVMGFDDAGAVATARATADVKKGWLYDVAVRSEARGRGIGRAILRLLLEHPRLRETRHCLLGTRDAQAIYEDFGFRAVEPRYTQMVRPAPHG